MTSGPTQSIEEDSREWKAAPAIALTIRAAVTLIPVLASWVAVRSLGSHFYSPGGAIGIAAWIAQALALGYVVSIAVHRVTRRLLPLATLYNMTLAFPDEAPSRFSVALRAGTLPKLRRAAETNPPRVDDPSVNREDLVVYAADLMGQLSRHDRLTRGHAERVRAYSFLIGQQMNLSKEDQAALTWGALLHDVGKLDVPQLILDKRSKPTASEWSNLKNHPAAARRRLEPLIPWLGDWVLAASEHHERWDGDGYPNKLANTEISLAGRIVAVADAYDVITSKRSYKSPQSTEHARREIVRCAGSQFDPDVVRAFLSLSLGRRGALGPFAGLLDLPRLVPIVSGGPAMAAGSMAAAAVLAPSVMSRPLAPVDTASTIELRTQQDDPFSIEDLADAAKGDVARFHNGTGSNSTAAKDDAAQLTGKGRTSGVVDRAVSDVSDVSDASVSPGNALDSRGDIDDVAEEIVASVPTSTPDVTISVPPVTVPTISVPPISVPILPIDPIELPVVTLPPITVPPITVPSVTLPPVVTGGKSGSGLHVDLGLIEVNVAGGGIGRDLGGLGLGRDRDKNGKKDK